MAYMQNVRCCGVGEVYGLSGSTAAQIEAVIAEYRNVKGMVFATTTQQQRAAEAQLEAIGFTMAHKFRNPNSGNTVKFWIRTTAKPEPATRKRTPRSLYRYFFGGAR